MWFGLVYSAAPRALLFAVGRASCTTVRIADSPNAAACRSATAAAKLRWVAVTCASRGVLSANTRSTSHYSRNVSFFNKLPKLSFWRMRSLFARPLMHLTQGFTYVLCLLCFIANCDNVLRSLIVSDRCQFWTVSEREAPT